MFCTCHITGQSAKKGKTRKKLQLTSCVLDVENTLGAYKLTIFQLNMSVFISDLKNRKITFLHNKVAV
jgi:hypothetical protein